MGALSVRLLIVDDNVVDREQIRRQLGDRYHMDEAATAAEALHTVGRDSTGCVLLDYRLPDRDGIDLLDDLVALDLPVVMLTGQGDETVAVDAMKRGAYDYLVKGAIDAAALRRSVANALETHSLRRKVATQQAELHRRVGELRMLLRQLPATVWTTDLKLRCSSVTGTARFLALGESELRGKRIDGGFDGEHSARILAAHESALRGEPASFEVPWRNRWFQAHLEAMRDDDGQPVGIIGVALDVSQNRELEYQLRQAQKMEALGQLAGGVAHDFNNILTVILAFAQFVKEAIREDDPASTDLDEVLAAAQRGTVLVKQLLTFSRRRTAESRVVNPEAVVAGVLPMVRRLLGENVIVDFRSSADLWNVRIDPGGLEQIVVNLAVNARDAMPRGGRISICGRNVSADETIPIGRRSTLPAGEYVVLAVGDEGSGIAPELQDRIFEPFFTTKGTGRGTGLGLSTCYGIARQEGGDIAVSSEPGSGTTFRVYLPRSCAPRVAIPTPSPSLTRGAGEELLVMEDDPQVRALVVRTLRHIGYQVLEAATVAEARDLSLRRGSHIRLVLTDVVMPELSGPELLELIGPNLQGARTLYMSGYADAAIRQRDLLDADAHLLEKPFTPHELAKRVREVLDE